MFKRLLTVLFTALLMMTGVAVLTSFPAEAANVTLPDLQLQVPTNAISIGTTNGVRMLRFTHITWDAGTGPFEIDPTYDSVTGTATFMQAIYSSPSPGVWQLDHKVPVSTVGVFDPPSDYQFPLTSFTLNQAESNGSPGAVVARSPKQDYCITGDTYVGGVANTPSETFIPQSNCTNPSASLGWSVGWGDEYDQTDNGQPIDLTGVPDGTYVLVGTVDPQHLLAESNSTNNVTDTTLRISGGTLTVLSQTTPEVTPPSVTMTAPSAGGDVSGTVTLSADASAVSPATITKVQFLLDGLPLGGPVTAAPYSMQWTAGSTALGSHVLSAQATDSNGVVGTAAGVPVRVVGNNQGGLTLDQSVTATGFGAVSTAPFSTNVAGETLIAMVSSDGPSSVGAQTVAVSGAGLTWALVRRANASFGDAEVWTATAAAPLTEATVTSSPAVDGYNEQLIVMSFEDAGGVGASATASAISGPPSVGLTTTAAGSVAFAVGHDWDNAVARTLGPGQSLVAQWVETGTGDTFWAQALAAPSVAPGQPATLDDTAPTNDQWDFAAVEVVPRTGSSAPPDTTPPTVSLVNPVGGQVVSGTIPVAADASDNVAVASVQFLLDGQPLGAPVTSAPYATSWDTTTASPGTHTLSAMATDTSGNTATAPDVVVTVSNPAPPMTCFVMQADVTVHGTNAVTTPSFHTAMVGETLLAFVSSDGPASTAGQSVTVSGAGLTWVLVKRENAQYGDAEVWKATADSILNDATVTSTPLTSGYDQSLSVIAMEGTLGVGASTMAAGGSGPPTVSLATTGDTALVFATGHDWDQTVARTPASGQVMLDQWLDTGVGDTAWTQYTNAAVNGPGTAVSMSDLAPTNDRWDLVAVELVGDTG